MPDTSVDTLQNDVESGSSGQISTSSELDTSASVTPQPEADGSKKEEHVRHRRTPRHPIPEANHCNLAEKREDDPANAMKNYIRYYLYNKRLRWTGISIPDLLAVVKADERWRGKFTEAMGDGEVTSEKLVELLHRFPTQFLVRQGMLYVQCLAKKQKREQSAWTSADKFQSSGVLYHIPDLSPRPVQYMVRAKKVRRFCEALLREAEGDSGRVVIGIDLEMGVNMKRCDNEDEDEQDLQISLIQISTMKKSIHIIDPLRCPDVWNEHVKLRDVLQSDKILKVIHDGRHDCSLLRANGIEINNIFDTSVAYDIISSPPDIISPAHKRISLLAVVETFGWSEMPRRFLKLKSDFRRSYRRHGMQLWNYRPVDPQHIGYAAFDVRALVPELYTTLMGLIPPDQEEAFQMRCRDVSRVVGRSWSFDDDMTQEPTASRKIYAAAGLEYCSDDENNPRYMIQIPFSNTKKQKKRERREQEEERRRKESLDQWQVEKERIKSEIEMHCDRGQRASKQTRGKPCTSTVAAAREVARELVEEVISDSLHNLHI